MIDYVTMPRGPQILGPMLHMSKRKIVTMTIDGNKQFVELAYGYAAMIRRELAWRILHHGKNTKKKPSHANIIRLIIT